MLLLKPLWIYGSVGFLVASGRRQLTKLDDIWSNRLWTTIFLLIVLVSVPLENWILLRHLDWEMLFAVEDPPASMVTAASAFLQAVSAVISYWKHMQLLKERSLDAVIRSSLVALSFFFSIQGLFYDSLMYSGSSFEYHAGIKKSFVSFFTTTRFKDAYIVYMLFFGPLYYYLVFKWNGNCIVKEKASFIGKLHKEILLHAVLIFGLYMVLFAAGVLPEGFGMERLMVLIISYFIPHLLVIIPVYLSKTEGSVKTA